MDNGIKDVHRDQTEMEDINSKRPQSTKKIKLSHIKEAKCGISWQVYKFLVNQICTTKSYPRICRKEGLKSITHWLPCSNSVKIRDADNSNSKTWHLYWLL